jgi:hypothetical protein
LGAKAFTLKAKKVICATPLHVTKYLVPHLHDYGFDSQQHLPTHAPWLVSNVFLEQFPRELLGAVLAWDNVRYGSQSLGYVVATHQWIRAAKPQYTVLVLIMPLILTTKKQDAVICNKRQVHNY